MCKYYITEQVLRQKCVQITVGIQKGKGLNSSWGSEKRLIRLPNFLNKCCKEFGRYMRGYSHGKGSIKGLQPVQGCIDRKDYLFGRKTVEPQNKQGLKNKQ